MSDNFRQPVGDKIHNAVKPDAQKPLTEKVGDQISGTADSVASGLKPNHEKSVTQKAADAFTPDNHQHSHVDDSARRGPVESLKAALTPDAQKPATTQAKDSVLGKADDTVGSATPHENKGVLQTIKDALNPNASA